jgi:hypothetical protein
MTKKQYNIWKVTVGMVKKSKGSDHLPVIPEEGQPTLAGITAAPNNVADIGLQFSEMTKPNF